MFDLKEKLQPHGSVIEAISHKDVPMLKVDTFMEYGGCAARILFPYLKKWRGKDGRNANVI